jgi:hypothetical protein
MLLDDARAVRERLIRIEVASGSVEEAEALATKANELATVAARLQAISRRKRLFTAWNVPQSSWPGTDNVKRIINQTRDRFIESPKSKTLVDGQRWSKLSKAIEEFIVSAQALEKQDWKNYFSSRLFAGVPPELRKQTILQALPENIALLDLYTRLYRQFIQYRNVVPTTAEALDEVHACSDQLGNIRFIENDNVPAAVKAFFDATSGGTGADLDLLNAEVINWLRANNMLANYVVRAR